MVRMKHCVSYDRQVTEGCPLDFFMIDKKDIVLMDCVSSISKPAFDISKSP